MSEENQPTEPENETPVTSDQAEGNEALAADAVDGAFEVETPAENHVSDVDALRAQLAEADKQVLLAQADLENFRKRTRRDMQDQIRYASLRLMNELLESVDNLDRAIESYNADPNGDGLAAGVKMVAGQIYKTLESHGCKKIDAVGQTFDPNLHQALQMQPSDEYESNTVMMDLRAGFQLYDRLIRPAQVFVSTGPAAKPAEGAEGTNE